MSEIWKDVKGYEGIYKISNLGNIKSRHNGAHGICDNYKELKTTINAYGYNIITLCKNGVQEKIAVHIIVAIAFLDHIQNKYKIVVDHINNIKTDNKLSNLQLITQRENLSKDKSRIKSKYVGVTKRNNKWRSQIFINGKAEHLGYFFSDYDAHIAYKNRLNETICASITP